MISHNFWVPFTEENILEHFEHFPGEILILHLCWAVASSTWLKEGSLKSVYAYFSSQMGAWWKEWCIKCLHVNIAIIHQKHTEL